MVTTILDCYTDEPAGLGVPPYLGTYPRYIAGSLDETPYYITIDDLRLWKKYNGVLKVPKTAGPVKIFLQFKSLIIGISSFKVPGTAERYFPGTWTPRTTISVSVSSSIFETFL